jgi:hypothetical protein
VKQPSSIPEHVHRRSGKQFRVYQPLRLCVCMHMGMCVSFVCVCVCVWEKDCVRIVRVLHSVKWQALNLFHVPQWSPPCVPLSHLGRDCSLCSEAKAGCQPLQPVRRKQTVAARQRTSCVCVTGRCRVQRHAEKRRHSNSESQGCCWLLLANATRTSRRAMCAAGQPALPRADFQSLTRVCLLRLCQWTHSTVKRWAVTMTAAQEKLRRR